ncbi:MAG: T9SS type A sorting domain-containing protein [Bacteroidia bacterium]
MKKIYFLTIILLLSFIIRLGAQEAVSMKAGYSEDVFYSFANGEVSSVSNTDWDIAFQISGFAASIRINSPKGVELRAVPGLGIGDWASVDTAGFVSWTQFNNSDQTWDGGAFNTGLDISNPFDLGWGVYNQTTHIVQGDSLFVISLADQSVKKLKIDQLSGGSYNFTYADIDGNNEVSATLKKADFENKTFGYYSFANDSSINREPNQDAWDIVFTRYATEVAPGYYYGVTGVLANPAVEVAEVRDAKPTELSLSDTTGADFSANISTIGYDWKTFVPPAYQLDDSLSYFVRAQDGETYLLYFTEFGGSATGDIAFEKANLTTSLENDDLFTSFRVFPNPGSGKFSISYELVNPEPVNIEVFDLSGRSLFQTSRNAAFGRQEIHIEQLLLPKGMYLVNVRTPHSQVTERLIIN